MVKKWIVKKLLGKDWLRNFNQMNLLVDEIHTSNSYKRSEIYTGIKSNELQDHIDKVRERDLRYLVDRLNIDNL